MALVKMSGYYRRQHTLEEDALYDLAVILYGLNSKVYVGKYDYQAAERAREFIHASMDQDITLQDLE